MCGNRRVEAGCSSTLAPLLRQVKPDCPNGASGASARFLHVIVVPIRTKGEPSLVGADPVRQAAQAQELVLERWGVRERRRLGYECSGEPLAGQTADAPNACFRV